MTEKDFSLIRRKAAEMIINSGIRITENEIETIEIADFGLGNLIIEGAQILTLVQTDRIGVKIIVLFPGQTLPEHWHPKIGDNPGKEETLRIVQGVLYMYIPGNDTLATGKIPLSKDEVYSCRHELIMQPDEQITLSPGTKHWFQAGEQGTVLYSFSTVVRDIYDKFTDPEVRRIPDDIK